MEHLGVKQRYMKVPRSCWNPKAYLTGQTLAWTSLALLMMHHGRWLHTALLSLNKSLSGHGLTHISRTSRTTYGHMYNALQTHT